jgi:hypothetical protein
VGCGGGGGGGGGCGGGVGGGGGGGGGGVGVFFRRPLCICSLFSVVSRWKVHIYSKRLVFRLLLFIYLETHSLILEMLYNSKCDFFLLLVRACLMYIFVNL